MDILVITLLSVLCGADNAEEVEEFGEAHEEWLRTFLSLPHGVPSQDTYLRVLAALNPSSFQARFREWVSSLVAPASGRHFAVDGKTLRGSHDRGSGVSAIHMVSAWAAEAGLVLGQVKTEEKSNELIAIPELLKLLDLKGATVTIDAMGCQRAIASQIEEQGGSYALAVKENQPTLYADLVGFFEDADRLQRPLDDPAPEVSEHTSVDAEHGRLEQRICRVSSDLSWVQGASDWKGLKAIARIESRREDLLTGRTSNEFRYYILSMSDPTAERSSAIIRNHWGIENSLHWVLDMTFGEDASRIRMGHAAENFATIRRTALNLLKARPDTTRKKLSLAGKRRRCSWNRDYLIETLGFLSA